MSNQINDKNKNVAVPASTTVNGNNNNNMINNNQQNQMNNNNSSAAAAAASSPSSPPPNLIVSHLKGQQQQQQEQQAGSPTSTTQQQQQQAVGAPEIQQHKLVNRLLREISVKVHHASSGKMTAEEVTAVENASKKANRAMREAAGLPTQSVSMSREGRNGTAGGDTSSRIIRRENEGSPTKKNKNNNRSDGTDTSPALITNERSPSAKPINMNDDSNDDNNINTHGGNNKSMSDANHSPIKTDTKKSSNNPFDPNKYGKRLVFAKSLFQRLPRASMTPEGYFKKHQLLGSGAFAQTFLCEWVSEKEEQEEEERLAEASKRNATQGRHTPSAGAMTPRKVQVSPSSRSIYGSQQMPTAVTVSGSLRKGVKYNKDLSSGKNTQNDDDNNNSDDLKKKKKNNNDIKTEQDSGSSKGKNNNDDDELTELQLSSPYGQVSHLASTKPSVISGIDNSAIPRDRAFVCKFEASATAAKRVECMGNITNKNVSEEHILANCAHPNIVAFVDQFQDNENNNVLVMEYVDGGDLKHELDRRSEKVNSYGEVTAAKHFSERSILFLFVQMAMAVEYLHRHNILHRDLKTPNILLSKKWLVKISDFGLAKQFDVDVDFNVSVSNVGTPYYLSPESFRRKPYSDKADIWCLGVILYELITLEKPFDGDTLKDLAKAVCLDPPVPFNRSTISSELKELCLSMLSKNAKDRPTAKQVLQSSLMESAMSDFLEKFAIATSSSTSSVDVSWNRLLLEQRKLINSDDMSSAKSRREMSKDRASQRHSAYTASLYSQSRGGASSQFAEEDEKSSNRSSNDNDTDDDDRDEHTGVNA